MSQLLPITSGSVCVSDSSTGTKLSYKTEELFSFFLFNMVRRFHLCLANCVDLTQMTLIFKI